MTRIIQLLRGTTAQNDAFTGSAGEITVDTTTNELRVHDGSTAGGHIIYTKSDVDTALSNKANIATTLAGYGITDGANTNLSNITNTGKEVCANMAMPSNRHIDLTLPASGGSIKAPADGYLHFSKNATAANQRVKLFYSSTQMAVASWSTGVYNIEVLLPVEKGRTVYVIYTAGGTTNFFRFTYAVGAQ